MCGNSNIAPPTAIRFRNVNDDPSLQPEIQYRINDKLYNDTDVNLWELRASRRALANIKNLLFGQPMLDLVQAQCEQGDAYYRSLLDASDGQWRECRTDMHVPGLKVGDITSTRQRWLEMKHDEMHRSKLLPMHPEHYTVPPHMNGEEGIVEVIGEHMARLRIVATTPNDVPEFVMAYGDPSYSFKKPTICKLMDGTPAFYILHEFRNNDDGCDLRLRLIFPAKAPQVFFDEHAEHLAIEFRTGVRLVLEDIRKQGLSI
ncbi:hypothetical protein UA08_02533 [Talaromyces atroroseus]|uniref:Uncharacterized protein n=1 Tax=Talaromyces atroroseus TaxID=1441469 RepID=A0A225AYR7_TALAT|nr:hypothetical protein UA08_02533 [Talaromyces atroroseus]OKL62498.1 hypothetical protein UA08_02533 [Talaromyces atroroseus]